MKALAIAGVTSILGIAGTVIGITFLVFLIRFFIAVPDQLSNIDKSLETLNETLNEIKDKIK